jgi:hypothetical protein
VVEVIVTCAPAVNEKKIPNNKINLLFANKWILDISRVL